MRRFFTEPLLHFLLLGVAIFVVFNAISNEGKNKQGAIVVTQGKIENLVSVFSRSWQHSPTANELNELIQDYIREEIAVREAVALGIDRDDTVIRRLLRQKLEFVTEDLSVQTEPTDEDLRRYLQEHASVFLTEPHFSFSQIYFNPQQHGARLEDDAAQLLVRLNKAGGRADVSALGDITSLNHQFTALPISAIAQLFGEPFAAALRTLEPGQWSGPVASGYGEHLIFVSERKPGSAPELEQVRDAVRREWMTSRHVAAIEKFYAERLARYTVTIEMPQMNANYVSELQ